MGDLLKDLAAMRKECFTIESGLECFNVLQDEPMTGEQAVRHALYLARSRIDEAVALAEQQGVAYSFKNRYPQ